MWIFSVFSCDQTKQAIWINQLGSWKLWQTINRENNQKIISSCIQINWPIDRKKTKVADYFNHRITVSVISRAKMTNIHWFQLKLRWFVAFLCCELNVSGFWTFGWTRRDKMRQDNHENSQTVLWSLFLFCYITGIFTFPINLTFIFQLA